jgi:hypothetical protein
MITCKWLESRPRRARKILGCLVASIGFAVTVPSQIVFTEIHYHPVEEPVFSTDGTPFLNLTNDVHEFVEIQNTSGTGLDISGWKLGGGISYSFPSNTTIASGTYAVIAKNPSRLATVYGLNLTNVLGPYSGYLGNSSDTVRLLDLSGNAVDAVSYSSTFPWAQAADALGASDRFTGLSSTNYQYKGRSLQRVSVNWPSSDPANWLGSPLTGPTPGSAQAITRAIPRPVVVAYSSAQAADGATIIRSNQVVTVNCTYSATNSLSSVTLEYFIQDINLTNQAHTSMIMSNLGSGKYSASIPGQTNRSIVRYRFKANRGDGLEVVSPRADDPLVIAFGKGFTNITREAWYGYFVTPTRTTTNAAIYDVLVSTAWQTIMSNNILQSPNRVTAASPTGLPRDMPYVAITAPRWDGTVPAVFACNGQVWDIQIRFHGSRYHRNGSIHSYKLFFPKHQELNDQASWFDTMHGTEFVEGQKINRLLGLPASKMRRVDWYYNNSANEVHSEQGEYSDYMLQAWSELQQQLSPGTDKEAVGDLYKDVGNRDASQNNNEGPYTRGDEAPMLANAGWTQLDRYSWTFTPEVNEWKGPKPLRDVLEGMWTARGDSPQARTYTNTSSTVSAVKQWFTNNWDIDTTITSMALLEWMSIWDDAAQNHYFWRRANGLWVRLGWDYDGVMSNSGGGGGGGGAMGGTTNQTIFGGEYGATTVFDGVNWWKDTFYKTYRSEYTRKLWELNNSFFDPTNLTAQGFTVASAFAKGRQIYINSVLSGTYGTYYKPNRPVNIYPPSNSIVILATNFVTSAYSHAQSTPHRATRWEIRTASGDYEEPLLRVTTTNSCLTNYPIPFDQLTYGQTYYWRATYIDTNGHPSVVSAETRFSYGTTNSSAGALVLNEILADNHSTVQNGGTYPDYIELRNNASTNISLYGYSLTDDPTNTTKYTFPAGTTIAAGGYLLVWCDSQAAAPGLHTGFGLNKEGQAVLLVQGGTNIMDSVTFGPQAQDVSIGRIVNGAGGWQANKPTPGTANSAAILGSVASLRVNEWMADPAYGNDWFELCNTDTNVVALAGLWLSDTPSTPQITQVPALSFIAGNGWTRFWADSSTDGGNHCNFALSKSGESIVLTAANGATAIDTITFSTQSTDVSQGRLPDGGSSVVSFANTVSPGYANWVATNVVINEMLAIPGAPLENAIELYNTNSSAVDIGGWWLSNDLYNRKKYQISSGTSIAGKSYKVFYGSDLVSGAVPFALNTTGGNAVLSAVDGTGNLTGVGAIVTYGAQPTNTSYGRVSAAGLNNMLGGAEFWPQSTHTFGQDNPVDVAAFRTGAGAANGSPKTGSVTINEIMYHPPDITNVVGGVTNVTDDSRNEFIELYNVSTNSIDLNGWVLTGDRTFTFTNSTMLANGSYLLLVSFDPSAGSNLATFRTYYPNLPASTGICGPYSDKLPNDTALLEVAYPILLNGYTNYVVADKVEYRDDSAWPGKADGKGSSLSRASSGVIGNNAANWGSKAPTPGLVNLGVVTNAVIATPSLLPGGVLGTGYTNTFAATGGSTPYSWTIMSGSVPGLTLSTNGVLGGTPATTGTNIFTVQLADSIGFSTSKQFTLVVAAIAPSISTSSLSNGVVGSAYSVTLAATNGTSPYTWTLASGSLPSGLALNTAGVISGTPTTNGIFNFTVQLADMYGLTASRALSLNAESAVLNITTLTPMPAGQVGSYYSQALTGAGGLAPYEWSLAGDSLPDGLLLDSLGDIAGTPTTTGTFNFSAKLTDSLGTNVTKSLAITIATATVTISTTALPDGTVGAAYWQALAATGGTPPYTWSLVWETLPPGLSLSSVGVVSGTPTNYGTFSFILEVTDNSSGSAGQLFTVEIAHSTPALAVQSCTGGVIQLLVSGDTGADYEIDASTNLLDWNAVFTTNAAATPFNWSDATTNTAAFYRVLLQP